MKLEQGYVAFTRTLRGAAIGGVAVAAVLGLSVAWGQVSSDQDQITACVGPAGVLRVINGDAGEQCKANETQLQWSTGELALTDGSVVGGQDGVVADGTIDGHDIKDGSVEGGPNGDVAEETIDGFNIKNESISFTELMSIDADGYGGITANKISRNAVTEMAISGGAVTQDKLSFDVATQVELNASNDRLLALEGFDHDLSANDSLANEVSDPVSWSKLKDIPTDLADGEIHSTELSGATFSTVSVGEVQVATGARVGVPLPVSGISPNDLSSVPPPEVLANGLVFGGAAVTGDGQVTVYLHNFTASPVTQPAVTYVVNWIDLTP